MDIFIIKVIIKGVDRMYLLNVDEVIYLFTEEQRDRLIIECEKFDKLYNDMLIKGKEIANENRYLVEKHPSYWGEVYLRWANELQNIFSHERDVHLYIYGGCNEHMEYTNGESLLYGGMKKISKEEADTLVKYRTVLTSIDDIFEQFEDMFICFNRFMDNGIEEYVKGKLEISDKDLQCLALDYVIDMNKPLYSAVMNGTESELKPFITQEERQRCLDIDKWHNIDHKFWDERQLGQYVIK